MAKNAKDKWELTIFENYQISRENQQNLEKLVKEKMLDAHNAKFESLGVDIAKYFKSSSLVWVENDEEKIKGILMDNSKNLKSLKFERDNVIGFVKGIAGELGAGNEKVQHTIDEYGNKVFDMIDKKKGDKEEIKEEKE